MKKHPKLTIIRGICCYIILTVLLTIPFLNTYMFEKADGSDNFWEGAFYEKL